MGRRIRMALVAAAVAGAGTAALAGCAPGPRQTHQDSADVPGKVTSVRVDSGDGKVRVRGGADTERVTVHRTLHYWGDRPKGATHRVSGGQLTLGGCGDSCSASYTVDVPAGLPVSGQTSNGEVRLEQVGSVRVSTSNGKVDLHGANGPVTVHTNNGEVRGSGLHGGDIRAETSNGRIDLTPASAQNVRAKTSNGAVSLAVPDGRYRVSARTDNGGKDIGVPHDPHGTRTLDLTTSNGAITVQHR